MSYYCSICLKVCTVAVILLNTAFVLGEEQKPADGLIEFKSEAGKFSINLPAKPEHEVVEVGTAKEKQHQFKVGTAQGAYIISYQDNPNLQGSTPKQIVAALESGRDRLQELFRGKLLESKMLRSTKRILALTFEWRFPSPKARPAVGFTW